ncbi:hypothetical protein HMPREF9946_03374 [Acetobacteraceae bacterium AT-5844]|nr:hypothetical protein HMPREF9946_03374 [Acetobacteraceae bacterium AT-5844]
MHAEEQAEHRWLKRILGDWSMEASCSMGPDQPPGQFKGKETVRALGDVWVIGEGEGEMPGGGIGRNVITLGYDPQRQRFVGTFVGSMMTHLWVYDGELNGDVLTLNAQGPSFNDPTKLSHYQDIVTLRSDDERILTSQVKGDDGQWTQFMTATYRRTR